MSLDTAYDVDSTTRATTQRCLPICLSRTNPSLSYVDAAPLKRKPAGTDAASSGYPSTVPSPRSAIRSSAPTSAAVAAP